MRDIVSDASLSSVIAKVAGGGDSPRVAVTQMRDIAQFWVFTQLCPLKP